MDYAIPDELFYSVDDEWVRPDGELIRVGVTDFAQEQLGEIVYVELPNRGDTITQGDAFGVIESVKAVADLTAPLTGEVTAINEQLIDTPELVNKDCYGEGWMIEIRPDDPAKAATLNDAATYAASVRERSD